MYGYNKPPVHVFRWCSDHPFVVLRHGGPVFESQ